jgi:hypothetical protein
MSEITSTGQTTPLPVGAESANDWPTHVIPLRNCLGS